MSFHWKLDNEANPRRRGGSATKVTSICVCVLLFIRQSHRYNDRYYVPIAPRNIVEDEVTGELVIRGLVVLRYNSWAEIRRCRIAQIEL